MMKRPELGGKVEEISEVLRKEIEQIAARIHAVDMVTERSKNGRTFCIFFGTNAKERAELSYRRVPATTLPVCGVTKIREDVYAFVL